jgi:hypothetical protein
MFTKANKKAARLRLALVGPAKSGKTHTMLAIAKHLGKRIAVIDTEHGSASKYADLFDFSTTLLPTFHPKNYVDAINEAASQGFDLLGIDSLSHAWNGSGGCLELVDRATACSKSANSFTAWAQVTPHHHALIEAILQAPMHIIATMRAKTEYVVEKNKKTGKSVPRKVGLAPVQRDGIEYEFDVVGQLDDGTLTVTDTRCPALRGAVVPFAGEQVARTLREWLGEVPAPPIPAAPPVPGLEERLRIFDAKLAAEGLCKPGECMAAVLREVAAHKLPTDWRGLDQAQAPFLTRFVVAQAKAFQKVRRQAKANGNGKHAATALDAEDYLDPGALDG